MPGLRKNTLGKNKFFGYQKERIIKCQRVSWPEDDVILLRPFFLHLCEAPDFDKGQDCWPPRDSVFIPMCNKRYVSKTKNKEIRSVSRKTDSLMFFSAPRFSGWIPIWSMGARHVYLLVPAFKPQREGAQGGAPSDIQVVPWPNVDGANSLSWNFIGIPRKPSYSTSFSLLLFSGQIPIWGMDTHQAC